MVNPRRFPDSELVERNPKLDIDALYRTGSLFMGQISRWACHWLTVTIRAEWERIWIDDQEVAIVRDRFLNGAIRSDQVSLPGLHPRLPHTRRAGPYIRLQGLRRVRLQLKAQRSLGARPRPFVPSTATPTEKFFERGGFSLAREGVQGVSLRRRTWRLGLPGACFVGREHFRRSLGASL